MTDPTSTDAVTIRWQSEIGLNRDEIVSQLGCFGDLLPDPLGARLSLENYADKLLTRAELAFAFDSRQIVGMLALYANDRSTRAGHIPIVSVLPSARGRGIGTALVSRSLARARQRGMVRVNLEVRKENIAARNFYSTIGFRETSSDDNRLWLQIELPPPPHSAAVPETAIEPHPKLAAAFDLDIDLWLKRDDLYPIEGGGIKARKILYIVREAVDNGNDVIVTNGRPQSNHARAAAVLSAKIGLRCHLIIVTTPKVSYSNVGNILLMQMSGATIEYCCQEELSASMDRAVESYERRGFCPLYVWGGGHCLAGTLAFVDAAVEARRQAGSWYPDFLVLASGTGTTQAGLAVGFADIETRVVGISVARESVRGGSVVRDCVEEYSGKFGIAHKKPIEFLDRWTEGGYAATSPRLLEVIARAARLGVFFDPTYSGKGWLGLVDLVREGEIPAGSKVLFWHTGGLMNLQASPFATGEVCS